MTENDRTLLLVSLQNGIGLASACELSMFDVKEVSAYIRKDKIYHTSCLNAIKSATAANLEFMTKLKKEKKFSEWHRQRDRVTNFITELTLWESYCKRGEIEEKKILKAVHIFPNIQECATAMGFYRHEFIEYVLERESLSLYLTQAGIYNF